MHQFRQCGEEETVTTLLQQQPGIVMINTNILLLWATSEITKKQDPDYPYNLPGGWWRLSSLFIRLFFQQNRMTNIKKRKRSIFLDSFFGLKELWPLLSSRLKRWIKHCQSTLYIVHRQWIQLFISLTKIRQKMDPKSSEGKIYSSFKCMTTNKCWACIFYQHITSQATYQPTYVIVPASLLCWLSTGKS